MRLFQCVHVCVFVLMKKIILQQNKQSCYDITLYTTVEEF